MYVTIFTVFQRAKGREMFMCAFLAVYFMQHSRFSPPKLHDPRSRTLAREHETQRNLYVVSELKTERANARHSRDNGWLRDFLKYRPEVIDEEIRARIYSREKFKVPAEGFFPDHKFSKYACSRKTRMNLRSWSNKSIKKLCTQ